MALAEQRLHFQNDPAFDLPEDATGIGRGIVLDGQAHHGIAPADVIDLLRAGNAEAITLARASGHTIGEIVVSAVDILNPELIIIGGQIGKEHEMLLASIRSVVYQRSLPLATRRLRLVSSRLDDKAGMIGPLWSRLKMPRIRTTSTGCSRTPNFALWHRGPLGS